MRRTVQLVISGLFTVVFTFAYYDRYWRWRGCFNELGRCYDAESQQVFLEQSGMIWGGLAVISAIFVAFAIRAFMRRVRPE